MGPREANGGNEIHISIWAKVTQVSDVAHGPLVKNGHHYCLISTETLIYSTNKRNASVA
jgi:hypothetical protein